MSEREKALEKWANRLAAAVDLRPGAVVTVQRLCYLCFITWHAKLELNRVAVFRCWVRARWQPCLVAK